MPSFRFIIEGSGFELSGMGEDGGVQAAVTGFFTTRKSRAANLEAAQALVLESLRNEWAEHRPELKVVDAWTLSPIGLRRVPNQGHTFFSAEDSRFAAASLEARAARAPHCATIWRLAAQRTQDGE